MSESTVPSAWLNLEPEDSDPLNLFSKLVECVHHALDLDLTPFSNYLSSSVGRHQEIPLYQDWLQLLSANTQSSIRIVFDGLDRLGRDATAYRFLRELCDNLPVHIRLMMLSREMPKIPIQDLRMRQEAFILTNQELAFTFDETKELVRNTRKLSASVGTLRRMHAITEGWVGGLVLFCESIEHFPQDSGTERTHEGLPGTFKRDLFQFFGEVLFSSDIGDAQELLIKTSILDEVEPPFAREFTLNENAGRILEELAERNLFIKRTCSFGKSCSYRYHQLFQGYLQSRFRSSLGEEEQKSSYQKAGQLYEERGQLEKAVNFYLSAASYDRAASVLERIGMGMLDAGRTGEVNVWLRRLPVELVEEHPWLLLYLSITRRYTGVEDNLSSLSKALEMFEEGGDTKGILITLAYLIDLSLLKWQTSLPVRPLLTRAESLLRDLNCHDYVYEASLLWISVGSGYMLDNPRKASWAYHNAYFLAKGIENLQLQTLSLVRTVEVFSWLGEFEECEHINKRLDKLIKKCIYKELRWPYLISCSVMLLAMGEMQKSKKIISELLLSTEQNGLVSLYSIALVYSLIVNTELEQYETAHQHGARVFDIASHTSNTFLEAIASLYMGWVADRRGRHSEANRLLEHAVQVFSLRESGLGLYLCMGRLSLNLIRCRLGGPHIHNYTEVQEVMRYCVETQNNLFTALSHFVLGAMKSKDGQIIDARTHLHAGFKIAQERGFDYFFSMSLDDLTRMCVLVFDLEIEGAMEHAGRILSTRLAKRAGPELSRLRSHPSKTVRLKVLQVQRTIHRSAKDPIRVNALGQFCAFRGGEPITKRDWMGSQPRELLQAILAYGGQDVSVAQLAEDLWPKDSTTTIQGRLKVNLHRLRKILEPDMDSGFGSSYVHLKGNRLFLDPELFVVDVWEFRTACNDGAEQEKGGNQKGALAAYKRAAEIYRGDFLSGESCCLMAEMKREELRDQYVEVLLKVAELYEERGALKTAGNWYKRIIKSDPFHEEAYRRLMLTFVNRRMHAEARKVYEDYREALGTDVEAGDRGPLAALYKQIVLSSD